MKASFWQFCQMALHCLPFRKAIHIIYGSVSLHSAAGAGSKLGMIFEFLAGFWVVGWFLGFLGFDGFVYQIFKCIIDNYPILATTLMTKCKNRVNLGFTYWLLQIQIF